MILNEAILEAVVDNLHSGRGCGDESCPTCQMKVSALQSPTILRLLGYIITVGIAKGIPLSSIGEAYCMGFLMARDYYEIERLESSFIDEERAQA